MTLAAQPSETSVLKPRPKSDDVQIAGNSHGLAWTESGFNASFRKLGTALEEEGVIRNGLMLHGFHTLDTRVREAGADDRTIADILGRKSTAMARHYSENARLPDQARELLMNLDPWRAKNWC